MNPLFQSMDQGPGGVQKFPLFADLKGVSSLVRASPLLDPSSSFLFVFDVLFFDTWIIAPALSVKEGEKVRLLAPTAQGVSWSDVIAAHHRC